MTQPRGIMKLTLRHRFPEMSIDRADVLWGIRRQAGNGDLFDPASQAGVKAHAFAVGRDDVAVCGFRPLRFRRRRAMPLAAASEYNPQCTMCLARLPEVTRTAAEVWPSLAERVAIPDTQAAKLAHREAPALLVVSTKPAPRRRAARDKTRAA
ncbi:MAG TPA: hypothetical protein VH371_04050 [Candidatus Limnocylindrales bacterium]